MRDIQAYLVHQLLKWSKQGVITSFESEDVRIMRGASHLEPRIFWVVESDVDLELPADGACGVAQAEWRQEVHKFANAVAAEFSLELTRPDIDDDRLSLHFIEHRPNST